MEVVLFVLGLCIGSFANVLIDRSITGQSVVWGASACDWCKKPLRSFELIPLISFVIQQGRCRRCHHRLSWQYPIVELASAIVAVTIWWWTALTLLTWMAWYSIAVCLGVLFVADFKARILPDAMIVALGIVRILQLVSPRLFDSLHTPSSPWVFVTSALGAGAFFFFLHNITRGRGMGFGDVKLAFVLGLLLGYPQILIALYVAFLTGAFVGVILMLYRRYTLKSAIAFGPFLIVGTGIALVWGAQIAWWWKGLL